MVTSSVGRCHQRCYRSQVGRGVQAGHVPPPRLDDGETIPRIHCKNNGRVRFGRTLATVGWFAERVRTRLIERTKAGLERARRQGKRLGRPPASPILLHAARDLVVEGVPVAEAARRKGSPALACAASSRSGASRNSRWPKTPSAAPVENRPGERT